MYRIILASESPRRIEIMKQMGIPCDVMPARVEEVTAENGPEGTVKSLSRLKARWVADNIKADDDLIIIGADTIVHHNGRILGKPRNRNEAIEMIMGLSGSTHEVYTGVCIIIRRIGNETGDGIREEEISFSVCTRVDVNPLTREQAEDYADTKEPYDKAGAYAIQGGFGIYIKEIHGDYYNVVGFPIARIYEELLARGINIKKIKK
ncbi:MAG: septum formation protein Maf [Clostridiales bacterium]|jgi:septum formation protein|nr:septum formation protein Maf [Clostridiales bacterium]